LRGKQLNTYFESLRSNVITSLIGGAPQPPPPAGVRMPTEPVPPTSDVLTAGYQTGLDNYLSKLQNICSSTSSGAAAQQYYAGYADETVKNALQSLTPLSTRIG